MKKFLIIQTAFIGDVVLATALVEKLADLFPEAEIDFLVRKGNEDLLNNNPHIRDVLIWNKREHKLMNLIKMGFRIRRNKYDVLINLHRFASSGFLSFISGARKKIGFDKNPFSFCYDEKFTHEIGNGVHEVERNLRLIKEFGGHSNYRPHLYCSESDIDKIADIVTEPYVVLAPASVWFTKQFPKERWIELISKIPSDTSICLIGAGNDVHLCEEIINESTRPESLNLAGKLNYLESAALMKRAVMNFVNDSAPLHFASAVNAPTTAIFCSTIPEFGFGPLSDNSTILQILEELDCRPCGLHGFKSCPKGHFKCALDIVLPEKVI